MRRGRPRQWPIFYRSSAAASEPAAVHDVSDLAWAQILAAEQWWRVNRLKAPNAIREELERASLLMSVQPEIGARARNVSLAGVRRIHLARVRYDLYYCGVADPERIEVLAFCHASRGSSPPL